MPAEERQGERPVPETRGLIGALRDQSLCIEQPPAFEGSVGRVPLEFTENTEQGVPARQCPQTTR